MFPFRRRIVTKDVPEPDRRCQRRVWHVSETSLAPPVGWLGRYAVWSSRSAWSQFANGSSPEPSAQM